MKPEGEVRLNEAQLNTIGYVVSHYGKMTPRELVNMTHSEAPWIRANEGRPVGGSTPIRQEWITEYFKAAEAADRQDEMPFDPAQVAQLLAAAVARAEARKGEGEQVPFDDPAEILAWAAR